MSQAIHLVSNTIPGCTLPDGKRRASGRAALLSSSSNGGHKLFGGADMLLKTFSVYCPRTVSVGCKASSNHRRSPDFSRQQKGSRGRNRHYQDRENSESLEEADNGSLLSLSSNQRHSATATPGRREKEIVELFRKVQAQLRERAAIKEEKKIEASQQGPGHGGQGERGTVDSLLKLLRKHSAAQGKKNAREEEFNLDQSDRSNSFEEEPSSNFFSSSSFATTDEAVEADPLRSGRPRPASSFRRRSPVPRVKFQPVFSAGEGSISSSSLETEAVEPEPEIVPLEEPDEESSDEISDTTDTDDTKGEAEGPSAAEITDLASLKLSELRDIAKSRGVRGYSKMKKADLVELLS